MLGQRRLATQMGCLLCENAQSECRTSSKAVVEYTTITHNHTHALTLYICSIDDLYDICLHIYVDNTHYLEVLVFFRNLLNSIEAAHAAEAAERAKRQQAGAFFFFSFGKAAVVEGAWSLFHISEPWE